MKTINLELRNIKVRKYNDILLKAQTLTEVYCRTNSMKDFKEEAKLIGEYTLEEIIIISNLFLLLDDLDNNLLEKGKKE